MRPLFGLALVTLLVVVKATKPFDDECDPSLPSTTSLTPSSISSLGHVTVTVTLNGPCLAGAVNGAGTFCRFHDPNNVDPTANEVPAFAISNTTALCVVPFLYHYGQLTLDLVILDQAGQTTEYTTNIIVHEAAVDIQAEASPLLDGLEELSVTLTWQPTLFSVGDTLDVILMEATPLWVESVTLQRDISNSGQHILILSSDQVSNLADLSMIQLKSAFSAKSAFSNVLPGLSAVANKTVAQAQCDDWYAEDPGQSGPTDIEPCPCQLSQAQTDPRFTEEGYTYPPLDFYHPGAVSSFRQTTPNALGAGQQCVYQSGGQIKSGHPNGGSADRSSPANARDILGHWREDILPWTLCCKAESDAHCRKYYERRPSDGCDKYVPPRPGGGSGDPHMTTFDNLKYDFMGAGEFWVIKTAKFSLQGRMQPLTGGAVTFFTAFVMDDGVTRVQVDAVTSRDPTVRLNDKVLSFTSGQNSVIAPTANIRVTTGSARVTVSFNSGFSIVVNGYGNWLGFLAYSSEVNKRKTSGLLGDYDDLASNDFRAPNGYLVPSNATAYEIYYNFGLPWMITKKESLFIYPAGYSYENYSNPDFLPNFKLPDLGDIPDDIIQMCDGSLDCLYDYANTGDVAGAEQAKKQEEELNEAIEHVEDKFPVCRSISDSNIPNGYVITTNFFVGSSVEFKCNPGFSLVGQQTLFCIQVGPDPRWSDTIPVCV